MSLLIRSVPTLLVLCLVPSLPAALPHGVQVRGPEEEQADDAPKVGVVELPSWELPPYVPALPERAPDVSFENVPLEQVLDWIREQSDRTIIVRWRELERVGVKSDMEISITGKNLRMDQLLWMVLGEAGRDHAQLSSESVCGIIFISTLEAFEQDKIVKIYDVRPLLGVPVEFDEQRPQAEAEDNAPAALPDEQAAGRRTDIVLEDRLLHLIQALVRPESWAEGGGDGLARIYRGRLIVRSSRSVHRELGLFLEVLRESVTGNALDQRSLHGAPEK